MGKKLVTQIEKALKDIRMPTERNATLLGRHAYRMGLQQIDGNERDYEGFLDAIKTFTSGGSLPYAYAGIAYTFIHASKNNNKSYDAKGLEKAMGWLEKAQALAPNDRMINVSEAIIYIYNNRLSDARLILDYLRKQKPNHIIFHQAISEIFYWWYAGIPHEVEKWFKRTQQLVRDAPMRFQLQKIKTDYYLDNKQIEKALKSSRAMVHIDQTNPMAWHKLSIILWKNGKYRRAAECNRRALSLSDTPEARHLETAIKHQLGGTGKLMRLLAI